MRWVFSSSVRAPKSVDMSTWEDTYRCTVVFVCLPERIASASRKIHKPQKSTATTITTAANNNNNIIISQWNIETKKFSQTSVVPHTHTRTHAYVCGDAQLPISFCICVYFGVRRFAIVSIHLCHWGKTTDKSCTGDLTLSLFLSLFGWPTLSKHNAKIVPTNIQWNKQRNDKDCICAESYRINCVHIFVASTSNEQGTEAANDGLLLIFPMDNSA